MILGIGEILKKVSEASTLTERVKLLRQYDCPELRQVIVLTYHPDVVWGLAKGWEPVYKPCPFPDQHNMFRRVLKREIGIFLVPGTYPLITEARRKRIFVQTLESLDPEDAKLLMAMKDRVMPFPGIYRKVVREAFPDIVPAGVDKRKLGAERRKAAEQESEDESE